MWNDKEEPTEEVKKELERRGCTQDPDNRNRFVNAYGSVEYYADGSYVNNGVANEKIF